MRMSILFILKCSLIALSAIGAGAQETNAVISILSDTNALRNFRLALEFTKTTFTNGEPVICMAGLTNVSDSPTIMAQSFFESNLKYLVTNANGVQISPIPWDYDMVAHPRPELIPAHSAERCFIPLELSHYFKLSPGTYTVCVVREMGYPFNDIMYTSKVVTVTILDSPPTSARNNASPPTK